MGQIRENLITIISAAKHSSTFCWRHGKRLAIIRLLIVLFTTALTYLGVNVVGLITNRVQEVLGSQKEAPVNFGQLFSTPLGMFFGVLILGTVLERLNRYYSGKWRQRLHFTNMRELNDHRATLDVAKFKSKEFDDLEQRIGELPNGWQTRIWFAEEMVGIFAAFISFTLFGASLVWHQPLYALGLILSALPIVIVEFQIVSRWWELSQNLVPLHKKRSVLERSYRDENAFEQAQMFNQMPSLRKSIDDNVDTVIDENDKLRQFTLKRTIFTDLVADIGLGLVVTHAVWIAVTKNGALGTLMVIIASARTFQSNIDSIVTMVAEQLNSAKGVTLIEKDFLGTKPLIQTIYPVVPAFNGPPPIEFKDVSFAYPGSEKLALEKVSFRIEPGSKVAIVGQSGGGKTTIEYLMRRVYDPTSGKVIVGGVDLQHIEPEVWSRWIAALTQSYVILDRPIGSEIASSRLDEPMDLGQVIRSTHFAVFEEVVAGYKTRYDQQIGVQFGGVDFSGGERQRLALARVFYARTPILILDEYDASLDPISAEQITNHIFSLQGVTVILITHHVSRAEKCDQVIVMQRSQVVEVGSHQELMARNGVYFSLYQKDQERLGGKASRDSDE
ncbi:MAG: ABC transporter ATP-binding protein [Patescibacteria group bacterium]